MQHTLRALLWLALGHATVAAAGDDLMSIYDQALEQDAEYRAALERHAAALEAVPQSRAVLLPDLRLIGSAERRRLVERESGGETLYATDQDYGAVLTQPIYHRDRIIGLDQAGQRVVQAEAELAAARQALALRVAERYFAVLAARDDVDFAKRAERAFARRTEEAEARFDAGIVAVTEVHEARARRDSARSTVISAERALASRIEALREITGAAAHDPVGLAAAPPLAIPEPADSAHWVQQALAHHPALLAAEAAAGVARHEVARVRAGHQPTLDLSLSHSYRDQNFGGVIPLERNDSAVGLELNVPIYQGGLVSSQTRAAAHELGAAEATRDASRRAAERNALDAFHGIQDGISQVQALEQAVRSSESALEAAEAGNEVGTRTILDVLDAESTLYRTRRDLAQARYGYLQSRLRLEESVGGLDATDLEALNSLLGTEGGTQAP
jgi:outer membrane protein